MKISMALLGVLALFTVLTSPSMWASSLVSVDFNGPNPFFPSPTFSGLEPAAAALDPLFGAANVWNGLDATFYPGLDVNPTWSGLVDSAGSPTNVGVSITGTVIGFSLDGAFSPDTLRRDYLVWNSNATTIPGESKSIGWQITGLVPVTPYDMCVYGARADVARSFEMTIGGIIQSVPTLLATDQQPSGCVLFRSILSDASGTISGVGMGIGSDVGVANEANWSGFQIAETPEPSSLLLLGTGLVGAVGLMRRKINL